MDASKFKHKSMIGGKIVEQDLTTVEAEFIEKNKDRVAAVIANGARNLAGYVGKDGEGNLVWLSRQQRRAKKRK